MPVFNIAHDMPSNLRDMLRTIEYSLEGVSPAIYGLMDNTFQLEDVDVWVWLKLIKPKKDSLVFLQKLTELFTVRGQWANLAGTCWWQGLPMLLSTSIEKVFEWKCPHMETLLDELAHWLGTYMGVDPTRALVNIEPYFVCKQSKVCYNVAAQRVPNTHEGRKYTGLHIPTPACPPGFWGSPSTSDDDLPDRRTRWRAPPLAGTYRRAIDGTPYSIHSPTCFCSHCTLPRQLPLL
ncbi:hypothetical protein K439DRAFT_1616697 [Ramaria rubella]|nr:hypothetical protein K439DRAFT_1616697 [Ramaria rubella]